MTFDLSPFITRLQTGQGFLHLYFLSVHFRTFFNAELGACGLVNDNGEYIVAVSNILFDAVPRLAPFLTSLYQCRV